MQRTQILDAVTEVLRETQRLCGNAEPVLGGHTIPCRDLPGFDSLVAMEAVELLSIAIQIRIEDDGLFLCDAHGRPRSIDLIVGKLAEMPEIGGSLL